MSTPGDPGQWRSPQHGSGPQEPPQYVDPLTGQPIHRDQTPGLQYQGFGVFDQPKPPAQPGPTAARSGNRGLLIALLAFGAIVVLLLVAGVVVLVNTSGSRPQASPSPAPAPPTAPSTSAGEPNVPSSKQTFVPPAVPGWQGVAWPNYGIAYDIPPSWHPKPGVDIGVGDDTTPHFETVSAYSSYLENYCHDSDTSYRALVGVAGSKEHDAVTAGTQWIQNWAKYGFTSRAGTAPKVAMNPPQPITLAGSRNAELLSATITPPPGLPCPAPTVYISTVAVPNDNGDTGMLMAVADQGFPGAVPPSDVNRIVTSLRWLSK